MRSVDKGQCIKGHNLSFDRSAEDTDDFQSEKGNFETKSAAVHDEARGVSNQYQKRPGGRTSQVTLRHGEPSVLK